MAKKNKYHVANKSDRTYKGIVYDSKMEMEYFKEVIEPDSVSGKIIYYEAQKPYVLQDSFKHNGKTERAIKYVADYYVEYEDGTHAVIDIKGGLVDPVAKLKRKMFWYKYPELNYIWVTKVVKRGGWMLWDDNESLKRIEKKMKKKES